MSLSAQPAPKTTGVVTSGAVRAVRPRLSRRWLFAGATIVVIALGTGGFFYIEHVHAPKPSHSGNTASQHPNSSFQNPAQNLADAQAALRQATTAQQKSVAYANLGAAYYNNQQPDKAITAYQSALAADNSSQITVLGQLASAYIANKQTGKAVSTLQQLVTLLQQSSDPTLHNQIGRYQEAIQELQAEGGA